MNGAIFWWVTMVIYFLILMWIMTRTEFVRAYAQRSDLSEEWAKLGYIDVGSGHILIALPCACTDEICEGWVMLFAEHVDHHLRFDAPEVLREAYYEALRYAESIKT